jgi:hypothetical protein
LNYYNKKAQDAKINDRSCDIISASKKWIQDNIFKPLEILGKRSGRRYSQSGVYFFLE